MPVRYHPVLAGLCLFLFALNIGIAHAQDVDEALSAYRHGDHQRALTIFKSLAEQGNAVACYNLALFYKNGTGVAVNPQLAQYWFSQAADEGLVSAYRQLNERAIQAGRAPVVRLVPGPKEWIQLQDPASYTLQLASSRSPEAIKQQFEQNRLQGQGGYFLNRENRRYTLVFGTYDSVTSAKAAISRLPESLRSGKPWIRPMRQIQSLVSEP